MHFLRPGATIALTGCIGPVSYMSFSWGKNCKWYRRTSRKAEDKHSHYKEGATYSPANHHYSTILEIYCSASFYYALIKHMQKTFSINQYGGIAVVVFW